jgi:mRNA interferase RelE/StbE
VEIRYSKSAAKELSKIGPHARKITEKVRQYAANPESLANNVKSLVGTNDYRLRVGDYRVLFTIEEDGSLTVMLVLAVRHRRQAYD